MVVVVVLESLCVVLGAVVANVADVVLVVIVAPVEVEVILVVVAGSHRGSCRGSCRRVRSEHRRCIVRGGRRRISIRSRCTRSSLSRSRGRRRS